MNVLNASMNAGKHECTGAEEPRSVNESVNNGFGGLCLCII